jgi:predicted ATPase
MEHIFTCVLTGGPGVGKSTVLGLLQKRGFNVIPEAARQVIAEEQKKENGILPWKDLVAFQSLLLERQRMLESSLQPGMNFLDRSMIDGVAYFLLASATPPEFVMNAARERSYDMVFLLDLIPGYHNDEVRWEGFETAREIHAHTERVYRGFGYSPILVPAVSPEERVELILARLRRDSPASFSPHDPS